MQRLQKLKCTSCGTMFMSENGITTCPTCSENQDGRHHHDHEGNMGGCGCGHIY